MRDRLSSYIGYVEIRVDRASVLGNPFELTDEADRDKVCDAYDEWLESNIIQVKASDLKHKSVDLTYWIDKGFKIAAKYKKPSCYQVCQELNKHLALLRAGKKIVYKCWCKRPDREVRCHVDSIKRRMLNKYYKTSSTKPSSLASDEVK